MTQAQGQGVPPALYRILHAALKAPAEFVFPTRAAAIRLRHQLYTARRRLAHQNDRLSPAFDTLSITGLSERAKLDGSIEWFWRIGESVLFDVLEAQLEEHCRKHGIDLATLDRQSLPQPQPSIPLAPDAVRDSDKAPPLPQHSAAQTDAAMAGYAPPPRPPLQRESTADILNDMDAQARERTRQQHNEKE